MLDAHLNAQRGVDTSLVSMRSGDAEGEGHRAQCHGELATSAMDTARDFESIRGSTYSFQMYRSGASPASAHRQNPTPPGSGRSSLRSPGQVPEASPAPPPRGLCIVYGGTFHGARIRCIPVPYARFSTSPCKAPSQVLLASLRACSSDIGDEQVSHVLPADALVSVGETRSVP